MSYDALFDSEENKILLAICARKLIRNIGIGAIIWGSINIIIGIFAIHVTYINAGILILGVLMLGAGLQALRNPTLGVLLSETIITIILFFWNLGIAIINIRLTGEANPQGLIVTLIFAVVFFQNYKKLQHVKDQIASIKPEKIKQTRDLCKMLIKKKLKDEPRIIQTTNLRCRAQLMEDTSLFIQRDMMRAFVASTEDIRNAIKKFDAKKLTMVFSHPLGKLTYRFNAQNSLKIKNWINPVQES